MQKQGILEGRVSIFKTVQETCGCLGTQKSKYVGGGSYICEHYNFAVVYPELLPFWVDKNSNPREFSPKSGKQVLMACKLSCGSDPYPIKLSLYIRNVGCDGCT
jgi:hypothetical protein